MEKKFFGFMAFAILIEAIVTYFKDFFLKGDNIWQMVICITLGIIIAISYSLDIPEMLGLESK